MQGIPDSQDDAVTKVGDQRQHVLGPATIFGCVRDVDLRPAWHGRGQRRDLTCEVGAALLQQVVQRDRAPAAGANACQQLVEATCLVFVTQEGSLRADPHRHLVPQLGTDRQEHGRGQQGGGDREDSDGSRRRTAGYGLYRRST